MIDSLPLTILTLASLSLALYTPSPERRQVLNILGPDIPDGLVQGTLGALTGQLGVEATYDYVVIGGGTAGSAIATRLSQAGHGVAILEAGEFYELGKPVLASTPGGDFSFVGSDIHDSDPLTDWEFVTTNQNGANGRAVHYARGKCVGGSYVISLFDVDYAANESRSALNFMIYQRYVLTKAQCDACGLK